MLMIIGLLVFMVAFIKVCSVHTPSSNPQKPPALKITDTLRRPIKRVSFITFKSRLSISFEQLIFSCF